MGVPELRQPGPVEDVSGPPYLRLHRNPVLEPGTDPGNQGPGAAPVHSGAVDKENDFSGRPERPPARMKGSFGPAAPLFVGCSTIICGQEHNLSE